MRKLAAGGSVPPPLLCSPGGANAHCSGGHILSFVSLRGEHLHDGVTPRTAGKNFQRVSPAFLPLYGSASGGEPNMSPKNSSRRSPWARRGPAIYCQIPASRLLREVVNFAPAAVFSFSFFFFLRLPADRNWDKVELLSLRSGEAARLQSGPPLLY